MKNNYTPEKILIVISLVLFAGIIFYNAFFIPEVATPSIIYVDSEDSSINTETEEANDIIDISSDDENDGAEDSSEESDNSDDSSDAAKSATAANGKININTATESELAANIPGVGESIAKRIVEYRNYNGDFASIDEIKNVSGIGDKKFEAMKDSICV